MAIRTDFAAGEVLAAADLNDTFGAKLNLAGGKILQIVRATDATARTTTSTSFVDATISVTITPQKNTSAILLIWSVNAYGFTPDENRNDVRGSLRISDSANNGISGAEDSGLALLEVGTSLGRDLVSTQVVIAYATPATTSATTYKGRFKAGTGCTFRAQNNLSTGQLYAIEVSA